MILNELLKQYTRHPQVCALAKAVQKNGVKTVFLDGLLCSSASLVFASLVGILREKGNRQVPMLFVLNDAEEAGYFYHDLAKILGEDDVLFFPSSYRRAVKYGQKDSANEILRTEVLSALRSREGNLCIVTHPEAVGELVVSRTVMDERTVSIRVGEEHDPNKLERTLLDFGFTEVDYVYEPGQFAMRGSIIDVYSFSSEYPFRIDFFGDEVDSIRAFEVESQLSRDKRDAIDIVPAMRSVQEEKVSLLSFLDDEALLIMKDQLYVRERIDITYEEGFSQQALTERLETANEQEQQLIMEEMRRESQLMTGSRFTEESLRLRRIEIGHKPSSTAQAVVHFHISPQPLFHKNFELLKSSLESYRLQGYELHILADSNKQIERLKDILQTPFTPVCNTLHEGFVDDDVMACFFTDHQIFDRFHKYNLKSDKARSGKVALSLKEINELQINDFIVHVDHGIGKFGGLVHVPNPNGEGYQEQVRIIYHNNDVVFVSIHSLYKISKYKGKDGVPPKLSRLGTGAWENMKERTKKKLKDIARDLIQLYSKRKRERGFAFTEDTYLQHELEASFLYEDTPDQLKATQEVKADMEKARPMDRLVCGDVGFGKTEVAVRAAFKAATDGKQVAVLVPTTVLAYQHFKTFSSRLKDMPVRVEYLSRARSAKQTKEILKDLAEGRIDILIGTHKLIGKTVKFHDLGLLIIDEEQKFGVATKEKLRQMKANVDTLTMSATPIPRTLQFSLMGARDMSVIQTPPPNRYPIQTELHSFSSEVIRDAVNFEMSRNGQVYFVTNRIANLSELETMLHEQVPDARIAVGHGRMKPEELEDVIFGFANYDYDVLLSTTIVENGIDIPNANTIIINGAQNFGLSDLHQMRGRVGRGNRKAFCYLLAPPKSLLSPEARRRLEAIENFSDLGSGIHLAMQDLDIRGAGNLLGAEQSGFIADLGYETYQKILNQAVVELRNETPQLMEEEVQDKQKTIMPDGAYYVDDCTLDSDLDMCFPELYVPSSSERILLYRQLDSIEDDRRLQEFRHNLIDRFGKVPEQGEELMRVVTLRRLGKQLGMERIFLKNGAMRVYFVQNENSPYYQSLVFDRVIEYAMQNPRTCRLEEMKGKRIMRIPDIKSVQQAVETLRKIMPVDSNVKV